VRRDMEARIRLLPQAYMGRRMQYALLSLSPLADDPDRLSYTLLSGEAKLSRAELTTLVTQAIGFIANSLRAAQRNCRGSTLAGIDCCSISGGPTLYTSGANDRKILERAGLVDCHVVKEAKKGRTGQIIGWTHAAISYAVKVLQSEVDGERREYDLPMLAKASLFSRSRGYTGSWETKNYKATLHELGTTLLGGAIAYLGRQRVSEGGDRGGSIEFYLLPDRPSEEYRALASLASMGSLGGNLAARAARLARTGVSLEAAISLSFAVMAGMYSSKLSGLNPALVAGSARIYMVGTGQRPMIRGGIPISPAFYTTYTSPTIRRLYNIATNAGNNLKNAAVNCVNKLFLQAQSGPYGDHIIDCARELEGAISALKDKEAREDLVGEARRLLESLHYEYARIVRGEWVA